MGTNLIVVQARSESSRLPNKVLLDMAGEPLLIRQVERIARIRTSATIVVATTLRDCDTGIVSLCESHGIEVFRGHPTDLLDRHYQAARAYGAGVVAKIPSDCPLIDPTIIDSVFAAFNRSRCDYASNLHPPSWPDGNDVEIMTVETLAAAWREAIEPWEREHTTPFIWERPQRFRLCNVRWKRADGMLDDYAMSHRWTVDYPEDYAFVRRVYAELYHSRPAFGLQDILDLLSRRPQIAQVNQKYAGVNWYRHHLLDLKTIEPCFTRLVENA
jgi:spore coat polysaccharide biosynthesis protein SpsF